MNVNTTKYKTLDKVANDVRVTLIYQDGDGIWVELADGWGFEECITIRGDTCLDVIEDWKRIEPYIENYIRPTIDGE